ncbi:MAG: hypothetical protein QOF89_5896 [Acidobacteriota bacterium]|jgi:hypothetical protein|nr:hypothetical protein [Acidobacteriota bacterium]
MTLRRLAVLLLIVFAIPAGCTRASKEGPSKEEIAKGQHLAKPFAPPGRCFGKPSKCVSDGQCAPPFSLCQEGTCCSGQIDPVTCECRCGNGPACGPRELCCDLPASTPRIEQTSSAEQQTGLRCRPVRECFGPD